MGQVVGKLGHDVFEDQGVVLEMEWKPQDEDKSAARELYVELLTRIATQPLDEQHGDEKRLWIAFTRSSQLRAKY